MASVSILMEFADLWHRKETIRTVYFETGRAKRGASGALYPQTALAGLNSLSRPGPLGLRGQVVLKVRSCAAQACEPGQDRKVAAVSGNLWVTWGCLAGANYPLQAGESRSTVGCTANPLEQSKPPEQQCPGGFFSCCM